ncbi:LuxR C-terminal-related transcriptional regulator [Alcanivorax sediminis]|uniref:AAA family ATPase n=1 Tax=Alcanivorax sediminis TaxID=2663008 RepID=A0A6N7LXE5_9GAMM|nr:LuxR C-terminal-related transcriptional regulator [Alcanivorax sediminis]MQX52921.1 AAA family ATPase [Alcanivorax sediminis]
MSSGRTTRPLSGQFYRRDLVTRLNDSNGVPLTLLLAPAGSGKSTLLSQWQKQALDRHVVSLAVQPSDDDPVRFLRRFAEQTRAVVPAFDTSWFMPFDVSEMPPSSIAEALQDALEQVTDPLYIVFDDFQHITNAETLKVLDVMCAYPPKDVHLIIASRTRPGLNLASLRLNDALLELDAGALKVNRDEVIELNQRLGGEPLEAAALDHLMSITEGWVAGVKIALMGAMGTGVRTLHDFHASQPEIMDYFGHAVLKGLPEFARKLFLESSLMHHFNAEMCDVVLETTYSAQLMEELSRRELFIIPVPGRPGWYRYHALLREFLQARVAIDMPERVAPIHRRATEYFLQQGDYEQALWHAHRADDVDLLLDALARAFDYWLREGYASQILEWAEQIPDEEFLARIDLAAPLISTLTLSRRFYRARFYLDAYREQAGSALQQNEDERQMLEFLELHLQFFQHDTEFMEGANLSLLMETSTQRDVRAFSLAMVAYYHLQHGRLQSALAFSAQAREVLLQLGQHFTAGYAGLVTALAHQQMGHIAEAVTLVMEQFSATPRDCPTWSLWATGMVVVLYDQNRLEEARQLCEDLLPVVSSASATEVISTVYLTLSRLQHHQGNRKNSTRMLEKLQSILQLGNYQRFINEAVMEMMRQAYVNGEWARLDVIAERFRLKDWVDEYLNKNSADYSQSWERLGLAAVYWLMASGRNEDAHAALVLLRDVVNRAGIRSSGAIMEANLLVLAGRRSNDADMARRIEALISRYGVMNINRSVFDEAPGLSTLISDLWRRGVLELPEFYTELFSGIFTQSPEHASLEVDPASVLTPKEFEIFELLQNGLSNAKISEQSGVSVTTTKWHLKNIYSKLGVSNRTEAVLRASSR